MKLVQHTPIVDAICCAAALMLSSLGMPAAAEDSYPSKPIRILVPSAPGSGPDIVSRLFGSRLTEAWGQQVVTDNRAGGMLPDRNFSARWRQENFSRP